MSPDSLSDLKLFSKKVGGLLNSRFYQDILAEESGVILDYHKDRGFDDVVLGPQGESVDAVLLTLRMFQQNKDRIAVRNIWEIFETEHELKEFRDQFLKSKNHLNSELDKKSKVDLLGKKYSLREALNLFLHGSQSHCDRDKQKELDEIFAIPFWAPSIFNNIVNMAIAIFIGNLGALKTTVDLALEKLHE